MAWGRHGSHCFEHDPDHAVETPEHRGVIEIEEGSMSASNSRYLTCHTGDDFDGSVSDRAIEVGRVKRYYR